VNQLVLFEDRGAVRVLTMNRPEARNALSTGLISALYAALIDADHDTSVRAVVLTGADPAFCAGLDLKQAQRDGSAYFERLHAENCITKVAQLSTPVLGAINGAAITGGMEMALGCDFLVASDRAVFADTHARVGILPGAGMTARLPGVVGTGMARRLSMTSEVIDAARAERWVWSRRSLDTRSCWIGPSSWRRKSARWPHQSCRASRRYTWLALARPSTPPWLPSRLSEPPLPGKPTILASVIAKSQNIIGGGFTPAEVCRPSVAQALASAGGLTASGSGLAIGRPMKRRALSPMKS
jgi:hypothetical protein